MGNHDNWTTPKQTKIEREGEPRGVQRGPLKKNQRKKGIKARMDELKSARQTLQTYAQWIREERRRPQNANSYRFHWEQYFDWQQKKYDKLLVNAVRDGILINPDEWKVKKP